MKIFWVSVLLVVSLLAVPLANAQGAVVSINGKCPAGWSESRGYCTPRSSSYDSRAVASVNGKCPAGWRENRGFCTPGSFVDSTENAVVKINGRCPSGYRESYKGHCVTK